MVTGHDQHLVGNATPVRRDHCDVVVGEHHSLVGREFGFDRGAEQATAGEAGEGPFLVEDLAGNERQPEDLAVRMSERCAGLPAVVHDRLGVANLRRRGVSGEPITQHPHQLGRVVVVEHVQTRVVVGRVHEDLVDAAGLGHDEDRSEVVHGERFLAVEGGIAIRDHPHRP